MAKSKADKVAMAVAEVAEQVAPKKKQRRRPQEVKARVLTEALNEFATHGFEGASAMEIAKRAHVSLPLLLYHYGSKENLWKAVIHTVVGERTMTAVIEKAREDGLSASEQLRRVIRHTVHSFAQNPGLHRLMTMEAHQPSDRLIWLCDTYDKQDFRNICEVILEAQSDGDVRKIDPGRLRFAIVAMAATPFAVSAEYQYLTRHNPFANAEIEHAIEMINRLVFE
jgi:TetR/AcrR family transcriptional regulator